LYYIVEVLSDYADKYGIALVNIIGHLTEYGKDLIEASNESGASSISDQKHTLRKLLQDSDNLERFYKDKEYREQLISSDHVELDHLYEQDRKLKQRLNLRENSTIRFEKVKGSNRGYWHAYFWNPELRKLKK
jgi:LAS superfamily LD-carboxypeptidase LdcB